ncbi:inhibin beta chain isoform X2 [Drosophila biarmipes]|uniref:inhibin beta chain isoform X2 n=1 Tax=Drosophila biarmipes TaxID=125945 RepID=UPI001CDAEF45|nr:inhibin beta chain isoform X2 [Drosophila biarmipes]
MRFASDPHQLQSDTLFKGNRCFFNCQCLCCRQGCCVVVVKCCCCLSFNCCIGNGSRKAFLQPAATRKKVPDPEVSRVSKIVGAILVLARWATTLLTSCILLDIFSVLGQPGVSDGNRTSSRAVHVPIPTTPNETTSSTSDLKLKLIYGYTSFEINNDQQVKSNNLCRMLCSSRNSKRQRRRRRRRRRRRHRNRHAVCDKRQQVQRKPQKHLWADQRMNNNEGVFQLGPSDGTCQASETNYRVNYDTVPEVKLLARSERSVLVSPLKEIISPWSSTQSSIRNCSKIKRNKANLVWLLIGLVWFEVKLINCNGISSGNYFASNLETHKGCTLCHEGGKLNIYNDKDNPHTEYNIYNKYHTNNYFNKKTNQPRNNIAPSDQVRLESIKRQILTKLGLSHKPNVSHPLPKQFIWETLYRADGGRFNNAFESSGNDFDQQNSRPRTLTLPETHRFSGRGERTFPSSQHQFRSPFDYNFNISKGNAYDPVLRNRSAGRKRQHIQKDDGKNLFLTRWTEKRPLKMNSRISSKSATQHEIHHGSITQMLKSGDANNINGISGRQINANAYRKSTYLIDINRSSDSSANSGINGEIRRNAYDYFNDYSVSTDEKNYYHEISSNGHHSTVQNIDEEKSKRHYESVVHDQEIIDHEDFFGNTQEIITFAEEGTQYQQYRILEFSPQNHRVPNQKLSIRSAQIHIRIDKPHSFWIERAKHLQEEHLLNTKRKWRANKPHHRIKIWVFQLSTAINITEKTKLFCSGLLLKSTLNIWDGKNSI